MFEERLSSAGIEDSKYYKPNGKFNTYPSTSDVQLPNCTLYAICRSYEMCEVSEPFPIARDSLGFGNAKTWYSNSPLPKGSYIRTGSIACFDGNYGHVAVVERKVDDTHALISESQYDPDKSLRNYKYWQKRVVELKVGKATLSGVGKLQGFLYLPIKDIRVSLNGGEQIEIIDEMVNVRKSPEGDVTIKGCFAPMGVYNVLEKSFLNGYYWYKIDKNAWVREGDWLIYHSADILENLRIENEKLKDTIRRIKDILNAYD